MNTIYLLEIIDGLGVILKPIETIIEPNSELIGKVIDNKVYGYTKEQCLDAYNDFCSKKIQEANERHMKENDYYIKLQGKIYDTLRIMREQQHKEIQCEPTVK